MLAGVIAGGLAWPAGAAEACRALKEQRDQLARQAMQSEIALLHGIRQRLCPQQEALASARHALSTDQANGPQLDYEAYIRCRLLAAALLQPSRPATADGREMTLEIKAIKSSSQRVYTLANIWCAVIGPCCLQESDQALRQEAPQHVERRVISNGGDLLAVGRLFDDDVIDPGGIVNRTILVPIPTHVSTAVVRVVVPLLSRSPRGLFNKQQLARGLSDLGDPIPLICPATSSMAAGRPAQGPPLDPETDRQTQRFDPQQATLTRNQQIGLP